MESRQPVSAARKYGGEMYGGRSSYMKSKELALNSDEDNLHDSLSDEGMLSILMLLAWFTFSRDVHKT